jgi:hypothetical protein
VIRISNEALAAAAPGVAVAPVPQNITAMIAIAAFWADEWHPEIPTRATLTTAVEVFIRENPEMLAFSNEILANTPEFANQQVLPDA